MKLHVSSPANEEVAEAAYYYVEESPQSALHFEAELEAAFAELAEFPFRYPIDHGQTHVNMRTL
ncbi:MAG TPA: hypothetical protein VGM92_13295 [Candidatus Kapabacteria bacterium]|jgi:plasmid stabilization system protein ParE